MGEVDVVSVNEAATLAGCSRRTIFDLIAQEKVTPLKVRRDKRTHVSLSEVKAALAALPPARRRPRRWRDADPPPVAGGAPVGITDNRSEQSPKLAAKSPELRPESPELVLTPMHRAILAALKTAGAWPEGWQLYERVVQLASDTKRSAFDVSLGELRRAGMVAREQVNGRMVYRPAGA